MLLIECPHCGPRNSSEFSYSGTIKPRPTIGGSEPEAQAEWRRYLYEEDNFAGFATERSATLSTYEPGVSSIVIEFARGGPEGATPPLPDPHGYAYALRYLSPEILRRASVLYVWVTPHESRRRNQERSVPGPEGDASILHHGVPETVMRRDYGVDDFLWLVEQGGGIAIEITTGYDTFRLPAVVFDNRIDHTSFLRSDEADWDPELVKQLHTALAKAFTGLR